jgi:hypothetical protein
MAGSPDLVAGLGVRVNTVAYKAGSFQTSFIPCFLAAAGRLREDTSQDLFIGYFLDSGKEKRASDPLLYPGTKNQKMPLADAPNIGF